LCEFHQISVHPVAVSCALPNNAFKACVIAMTFQ